MEKSRSEQRGDPCRVKEAQRVIFSSCPLRYFIPKVTTSAHDMYRKHYPL